METVELVKHFPIRSGVSSKATKKGAVHAVDGISIWIKENETLGLVGESGSGKTTYGQCVLMLTRPSSGSVRFDGVSLEKMSGKELRAFRRNMQIVFQDPNSSLDPRMRICDIIAEPLTTQEKGLSRNEVENRVRAVMKKVGLNEELLNRRPHEFSGGQRQRIAIARAIITNPRFIVLDEPTSSLDVSIQANILNLLVGLQQELHLSYLFISHNIDVVKYISDEIAVMYLGKIVEVGDTASLMAEPLHPYTQMLISSVPSVAEAGKYAKIEARGETPSAVDIPTGCRFHPRCPFAKQICRNKEPALLTLPSSRRVACFMVSGDPEYSSDPG